jgi:hypothetical protein
LAYRTTPIIQRSNNLAIFNQGGFTKGEPTSSLLYIYIAVVHPWTIFQLQVAPLVLKLGIHQGQARRKRVNRREDEGKEWEGRKPV